MKKGSELGSISGNPRGKSDKNVQPKNQGPRQPEFKNNAFSALKNFKA